MHTFRPSGGGFDVVFVTERGADVVYRAIREVEAMAVVSYLNGGEYPPYWNPPQ